MNKNNTYSKSILLFAILGLIFSCEDFVEVAPPNDRLISQSVFDNENSARSAIQGIYNQLMIIYFSNGGENSVTNLAGLSADNLETIRPTNATFLEFQENEILPDNNRNLGLWSGAYNIIYLTNSLLEGISSSDLNEDFINELAAQARFIRAFSYFYLVNLYGEVPLLLSTDYVTNAVAEREPVEEVYAQIVNDLQLAIPLLNENYTDGERTTIVRSAGKALLARVQLYRKNWIQAAELSTQVISNQQLFTLLDDLNQVFLKNSREAIWQLSPLGRGNSTTQTEEGALYVIDPTLPGIYNLQLTADLITNFSEEDQRAEFWIGYFEDNNVYYPYKYKDGYSTNNLTEYSMVLRLAEQYLIRAEARVMMGQYNLAVEDINRIKQRAGIELLDADQQWSEEDLLEILIEEKRKEFFTEWGHRWLDLKRLHLATSILSSHTSEWQPTDVLYPIPEEERLSNINLSQNEGY